jgi:transcriptional regulator with XRE-family HTH domain
MAVTTKDNLGRVIKQRRLMAELTLSQLSARSGVSISHLGRIERGERLPSASILQKLAKPLGLSEVELFSFVGYLSPQTSDTVESTVQTDLGRLDPYVATLLSSEPLAMQRALIGILAIMKEIAGSKSNN